MKCGWCGAEIRVGRYCSTRHRVAAWRERHRYGPQSSGPVTSAGDLEDVTPASASVTSPGVAALYVRSDGPYAAMPDVDPWPEERDATQYTGPGPVVAHPPCAPWGRYRHISGTRQRADLAVRAVDQVRWCGGVLEHPAESHLWTARELPKPGAPPDRWGGWSYLIRQSWWGHRAPKLTWLYIVGRSDLPPLPPPVPDPGGRVENMCRRERELTPPALASWLVELARGCRVSQVLVTSSRDVAVTVPRPRNDPAYLLAMQAAGRWPVPPKVLP